jgi:DNA gyrase subunit A
LIKVEAGEKICAMLTVSQDDLKDPNKFIVMASRTGYIKKSELALFSNLRRAGLRALVIEEDDDLIGAAVAENGNEILLSTSLGMACRFELSDDQVRPMGRTARGVTGMRFKLEGDAVVSLEVIREAMYDEAEAETEDAENAEDVAVDVEGAETEDDAEEIFGVGPEVLVVTDGGMGKRSFVSDYRKTNRGARGVVNIRLKPEEHVISVVQIEESDEILLTTERGQLSRIPAKEIRRVGRASKGVKIMNLKAGDRITGVAKIIEVEGEKKPEDSIENAAINPVENVDAQAVNPTVEAPVDATTQDTTEA